MNPEGNLSFYRQLNDHETAQLGYCIPRLCNRAVEGRLIDFDQDPAFTTFVDDFRANYDLRAVQERAGFTDNMSLGVSHHWDECIASIRHARGGSALMENEREDADKGLKAVQNAITKIHIDAMYPDTKDAVNTDEVHGIVNRIVDPRNSR